MAVEVYDLWFDLSTFRGQPYDVINKIVSSFVYCCIQLIHGEEREEYFMNYRVKSLTQVKEACSNQPSFVKTGFDNF